MILEACVGNYSEAIEAQKLGANRIELCDNLAEGGTTPSYGTLKLVVQKLDIPVIVMIRPRGGNFVYTDSEIDICIHDIKIAKKIGATGIAVGVLTKDNQIDVDAMSKIMKASEGLDVTFHKAIDAINVDKKTVQQLVDLGVKRILTSGGSKTALLGAEAINEMIKWSNSQITIVAAAGITKHNKEKIIKSINTTELHGSKIV